MNEMGKYTIHDDKLVDLQIQERIDEIVSDIVKNIPSVDSLILTGGFGKGEGSAVISDGKVRPLRDFDFVIVSDKKVSPESIQNVKELLGQDSQCDAYKYNKDFSIDISTTSLDNINIFPDVMTYDFKNSKVVYGEDIRKKIRWNAKDIPLRSGARLLFQKSTALIGVFSTNYLSDGVPESLKNIFMREVSKVYIEIGSALCILMGQYDSHCSNRAEILNSMYETSFPELFAQMPTLSDKISKSTQYKLNPSLSVYESYDPISYWFETRDDLGEVMKYFFRIYCGFPFDNWLNFSQNVKRWYSHKYFPPLIKNYLEYNNFPKSDTLVALLNVLFNINENLKYVQSISREPNLTYNLSKMFSVSAPAIRLYSVCPLLLFSIDRDGNFDENYLDKAIESTYFTYTQSNSIYNKWEMSRLMTLKMLQKICTW